MYIKFAKGSRTKVLAIITLSIMAVFVFRLFYLQIVQHNYYVSEAHSEQLKQFILPAERGELYAMDHGKPTKLVMNEAVFTVFVDPKVAEEPKKIIETLHRVAGGNVRPEFEKLLDKKESRYQIVATNVTRKQAEMIKEEKLYGVGFQAGSRRVYPEGQLAAQVTGFVNNEGKGQYGIEGALDSRLKGKDGLLQTVTDVRDVPLTIGGNNIRRPAKNGENIVLTIDRNIQANTEKALASGLERTGGTKASAIVMDPKNGKVLAMANLPTYRPAEYNKVTDAAVFNNSVITTPYEIGSVAKTFTVAIGLDKKAMLPSSTFVNTDSVTIGPETIGNATKGKTGTVTMQTALDWSLNTGMVTIARRLGDGNTITYEARKTMYDYLYNKFGMGSLTGIQLAGEAAGTIISPDQPNGNAVQYATMSFGQGMNVTMVQAAAAFSSIINGGDYYKPTVVAGSVSDDGEYLTSEKKSPRRNVISAEASQLSRQMIHQSHLTTYRPNNPPGYYLGGKTGTSQTIDPRTGKYTNDETIATYLGFGGSDAETPEFVVMVQVSGKGKSFGGGADAKPIFNDISNWLIEYLKLQPKSL